jgi:hypothetical protein
VVAALALTGAALFILTGLGATARLVHIGNLDAQVLVEKLATPWPVSALDWPELRLSAVVPQPGRPSVVLVHVQWPGHDGRTATLLIQCSSGAGGSAALLSRWCARHSAVLPSRRGPTGFELRRRQTLERVCGRLLAEDAAPAPQAPGRA